MGVKYLKAEDVDRMLLKAVFLAGAIGVFVGIVGTIVAAWAWGQAT